MAKWYPNEPKYKELEDGLEKPDPVLIERVLAEKDEAIAAAHACWQHLSNAKPLLTSDQYDDLAWRLQLLERTAVVWRLHAEALFGYKALAEGHGATGLKERVERALAALDKEAEVSGIDPRIGNAPPASVREIRDFTADLRKRLAGIQTAR